MNRIGDHALIGDCHSAALVGGDGRIEWACFPRFDSPAVFCAVLDDQRGGAWSFTAAGTTATKRAYLPGTNVLVGLFAEEVDPMARPTSRIRVRARGRIRIRKSSSSSVVAD